MRRQIKGDETMLTYKNLEKLSLLAAQRRLRLAFFTATVIITSCIYLWARPNNEVPYPTGYRHWVHVKTAMIGPKSPAYELFGGLYHIYANEKAMEGYRTGRFPDGSIIVFDLFEAIENQGVTTEGPRRRIGVMVKESKRYAETGGWGFGGFRGDSQTERTVMGAAEATTRCFACHTQKKENDFVFSVFRK